MTAFPVAARGKVKSHETKTSMAEPGQGVVTQITAEMELKTLERAMLMCDVMF